jgi:hypothetical protein
VGSCGHYDEPSGSTKDGGPLQQLLDFQEGRSSVEFVIFYYINKNPLRRLKRESLSRSSARNGGQREGQVPCLQLATNCFLGGG